MLLNDEWTDKENILSSKIKCILTFHWRVWFSHYVSMVKNWWWLGYFTKPKAHPDILLYIVADFLFKEADKETLCSMNYALVTELLTLLSLLVFCLEPCLNVVIHERCRQHTCQAKQWKRSDVLLIVVMQCLNYWYVCCQRTAFSYRKQATNAHCLGSSVQAKEAFVVSILKEY